MDVNIYRYKTIRAGLSPFGEISDDRLKVLDTLTDKIIQYITRL